MSLCALLCLCPRLSSLFSAFSLLRFSSFSAPRWQIFLPLSCILNLCGHSFARELRARFDPESSINRDATDFQKNSHHIIELLTEIKNQEEIICQGGGAKAIESQHKKGRLTARERIAKLIDPKTHFFELSLFAAFEMYEEWGGAPSAGTVTGLARICGRLFMLIANDATRQSRRIFSDDRQKVIRAQNIAIENKLPTIYLVDSAGIFLPLQEDVFPDTDDFGRVFRNNAVMSAMGIPQLTAIMGMCVAGGAYLPVMCDHILMTEGSGLFLAGPALVQAAIGQKTSAEELGGAKMHSQISGTVDFREPNDESCLARIRALVDKMGAPDPPVFSHTASREPLFPAEEVYGIFSRNAAKQYDMRDIIARIVDGSEFEEYRAEYGETLLCGYARIGGWAVGIVANQKKTCADHRARLRSKAHRIRRRHLHRVSRKGRPLYPRLQSESHPANFSS